MAIEPKGWWASRKFWVMLLLVVVRLVLPACGVEVPGDVVVAGLTYIGAEGLADAAGAYGRGRNGR